MNYSMENKGQNAQGQNHLRILSLRILPLNGSLSPAYTATFARQIYCGSGHFTL
jgi:hypothetical protein